ncbi:hypothetical protein Tco_0328954 [Tanacetum coccineum]
MWNPFRRCGIPSVEGMQRPLMASYVHYATSGPRQRGTGLSSGPLCFLIVLLGLGPRKAYVVQARRPALRNIRHQVPPVYITDIKSVLTQKALSIFCKTFRIPDEVHPELPSPNQTIHEMPTGKIGVYTRFFEYANFRLPLSIFLVNVLKHYRIHISQLSVIAAAKVSHFEIMCRVHGFEPTVGLFRFFYVNSKNKGWMSFSKRQGNDAVCYTKPLDSLKGWNGHFFWVDAFACPTSFPWNTSKSVSKDPFPKSFEFNAEHYATLIAYPAPFHKYLEPFLCLVGMSRHYTLDENTYPEFLHDNDEEMDLLSFIRTADPTKVRIGERQRAEEEPKLLDTTVGRVVPLLPVAPAHAESELEASVDKLFDESGSGNPAEQGDSASGGQGVGIQLVSEAVETVVEDVAPLQPMRQKKRPTAVAEVDSVVRSSIPIMTVATTVTSTVDPATIVKENFVESSLFSGGSSSAGGAYHTIGGFSDLTGSDFIVSGIRTVISPDTDLQKVSLRQFVEWNMTNFSLINVGAARQMSLSAEVRMRAEYNIKENRRLKSVVDEQTELLKVKEREIKNFKAQLLLKEVEAAEAIHLRTEASKLEAVKKSLRDEVQALRERNSTLKKEKNDLDVKVADLAASVKVREHEVADLDAVVHDLETSSARLQEKVTVYEDCMALHLEDKFYPHLLTTIAGRRWLLTHGMKLAIAKCLNSPEYLSALGAAISKAIEKGMQDGLAAGITHDKEGRILTDVAAYNPFAEVDYISALQQLQNVNFSLLAELKLNKNSSVETLMNILRLEETLAERLDLNESRVRRIKDNIANHRSALPDVFIPLAKPFSTAVLMGTEGTFGIVPGITTALSTTFASANLISPISTDDYEIVGADDQVVAGGNTNPFPNVDDAELNI